MIVVDTSALMAIVLDEPEADACIRAIEAAGGLMISAGTIAEALIVADRRAVRQEMAALIAGLGFDVIAINEAAAARIADAYGRWGKGMHPAGLNFGDCFAYDAALQHDLPLLFVGKDFSQTDIRSAL
jgi:ribonuclease VapC